MIVQEIPIEYLKPAEWAQNPPRGLIERIVEQPHPMLFGAIHVSMRSESEYVIIDGRVRVEAMIRLNIKLVLCVVETGLTQREEAEMRVKLHTRRRPLRPKPDAGFPQGDDIPRILDEIRAGPDGDCAACGHRHFGGHCLAADCDCIATAPEAT